MKKTLLTLMLGVLVGTSAATAATVTWQGDDSADFNTGSNWDTGNPPGVADDAVIPASPVGPNLDPTSSGAISVLSMNIAAGRTVTATGGNVTIGVGGLTVAGTLSHANRSLTVNGATDIQTGGIITRTSGAINFVGALTVAGTLEGTSGGTTVRSTWTHTGTFTAGTGTVTFQGTSAQVIPAVSFSGVTINNASGVSLDAGVANPWVLTGTLTLTAGNLNLGGRNLSLGGGFTVTGGSITGTPNVEFTGSANATFGGSGSLTVNDVTSSRTGGTITLGGDVTVNGNVNFAGGSLSQGAAGRNLIGAGGAFSFTGATLTIFESGTTPFSTAFTGFAASPTVTATAGVTYNQAGSATVDLTSFNSNLTVTGGGSFVLGANTTVGTTLTIGTTAATSLNASGFNLNVGTTMTVNNGTSFNAGSGTITAAAITLAGAGPAFDADTAVINVDDITLAGGAGAFNADGSTINIADDFGGTAAAFSAGTGTVNFVGGAANDQNVLPGMSFNNFTVNGNATARVLVSATGTVTVNGALNVTSGILDVNTATTRNFSGATTSTLTVGANGTLRVRSTGATPTTTDYQSFVAIVRGAGSTVEYMAATTLDLSSFHHLIINGAGTFTLGAATTVQGNLTRSAGNLDTGNFNLDVDGNLLVGAGTLTAGTSTINVGGNLTGAFTGTSSTVILDGTGAQSIQGTANYGSIQISANNRTVTPTVSLTAAGTFSVGANATYDSTGFSLTVAGATTVDGTLNIRTTGGTVSFSSLTINSGGSVVSSGNQAVTVTGALAISGTYNGTAGGAITVDGGVTINTTGTLTLGSQVLTINGSDFTRNGSGAFTAGTSTVTFGTGDSAVTGTFTGANSFSSLTLSKTAAGNTLTVNNNIAVSGVLAVTTGTLIPGAQTVTVTGNVTKGTNGSITPGTSLFVFNGSSQTVATLLTFNDVDVITGSGVTFGAITANTFDIAATTATTVSVATGANLGAVTVGDLATVTVTGTGTLTVSSLSNDGAISFNSTGGLTATSVTLTGNGSLSTTSSGAFVIPTLNVPSGTSLTHGSGAFTVSGTATIGGAFTKSSGAVSVGTLDLTANANYQPGSGNATYSTVTIANTATYDTTTGTGTVAVNGNLTIAGSFDAADGTGTYTVTGNVELQSTGSFTIGTRTLDIVNGNWTKVTGSTLTATGSTVSFTGTTANTVTGITTFNNLTLNKSSNGLTVFDDITVANLVLTAGTLTFDTGNADVETVTVSGNITRTTGLITAENSKFLFTGTGQTVASGLTFFDVEIANGASVATFAATTITGTLTTTGTGSVNFSGDSSVANIVNNGAMSFNTNVDITTSGNITNSGTMTFAGAGTINIAGNWTGNGLATGGTPTVTVSGNDSTLVGSYYNLVIAKTAGQTASANGAVTVLNTLTLTSGTLDMNGNGLTLQGVGTAAVINGADGTVFLADGGTVTFSGSGTDNDIDLTAGTVTFHHVVVNKGTGNKLDVQTAIAVTGDLTVTSGILDIDAPVTGTAVTGNVSIAGNGQILLGTRTLAVAGTSFTVNGTFSSGATGTLLLNGSDNVAFGGTTDPITLGNLTVSLADSTDTVDLAQNITVSGSISITEGILDASGNTVAVTADIAVQTGGQFTAGTTTTVGDDIQMDGGSYLAGAGATSITDDLQLNGGTFNAGSATTTISGSITGSTGGGFTKGSSTVRFIGAGTETVIVDVIFNNVLVERSATLTINNLGTFDVDGTLTINNNAAATTVSAGATDVTGAVLITLGRFDTSGTTTMGSSLNIVDGEFENLEANVTVTGAVTVGDTLAAAALLDLGSQTYSFGSLTVAVTDGTVTLASGFNLSTTGAMTVNGTFGTVNAQGTLTVGGAFSMASTGVVFLGTGDPTVTFNGTVTIPSGASWTSDVTSITMNGASWTQGALLTVNATSSVTFGGGIAQNIVSGTFPNLVINKSANAATLSSATIVVLNNLTLTAPAAGLNLNTRQIQVAGNILGTGNVITGPTGNSQIRFNGTVTQTMVSGITVSQLVLDGVGNTVQVPSGGITVNTSITVQNSSTLDQVAAGRTISGDGSTSFVMSTTGATLRLYENFSSMFPTVTIPASVSGTVDWLATIGVNVELLSMRNVTFGGTGTYALTADTTVNSGSGLAQVTAGARLNTGSFNLLGTGTFTLNANGTLGIGSVDGITDSGATGNIRTTTRNYSTNGIYSYNGSALQVTGNGLPGDAGQRVLRLSIDNASGVVLSQSTTASNLTFSAGHFFTSPAGSPIVMTVTNVTGSTGALAHVVGQLAKPFPTVVNDQSFTFPVGDGTNYTPVIVTDIDITGPGRLVASARTNYVGSSEASYPPAVVSSQQVAGLNKDTILNRSWTIDFLDGFTGDFDPQFAFLDTDVTALTVNTEESKFVIRRYNEDVNGLGEQWFGTTFGARVTGAVPSVRANELDKAGDFIVGAQAPAQYTFNLGAGVIGFKTNVVSNITVDMADYIGEPLAFGFANRNLQFAVAPVTGALGGLKLDVISGAGFQECYTTNNVNSGITIKALGTVPGSYTVGVVDNQSPAGAGAQTVFIGIGPTAANGGSTADFDGSGMYGLTPNLYNSGSWNGFTPGQTGHEAVTVEMWFRADAAGVLLDERGAADLKGFRDSWIELVQVSPGVLDVRLRVWNLPTYPTTGLSLGTVGTNTWNHVVLRYSESGSGTLDGFLNGVKSGSSVTGDRTTPIENGASGIYYGLGLANTTHLGSGAAYDGSMDEVRIWNIARSDAEILANWNKTVDPQSANLLAYYRFEDGVGTIMADETANDNFISVVGNTPVWGASGAMTNAASRTFTMLDTEVLTIALNGYDPDNTGAMFAQVRGLTGTNTVAQLQQTNGMAIGSGFVTVSNQLVHIDGLTPGTMTFEYRVNNGIAVSASVTMTVNVLSAANAVPTLTPTTVTKTGNEDSAITINYSDVISGLTGMSVSDGDGPSTVVLVLQSVSSGTLLKAGNPVTNFVTTLATGQSFTWTPPMNYTGTTNAFTFKAYDGQNYSVTGTAQVIVSPVGDAPIAQFVSTALELNGTNYLFTPNLRNKFTDETVTLELWFRPSTNSLGNLNPGVLISERGQNGLNGWRASQIELLQTGEIKARAWNLTSLSLGYVQTNNWNHVVVRYNKATSRTEGFLNGVKAVGFVPGDRTAPWEGGATGGLFYDVGAINNSSANLGTTAYFKGHVNEFRIWSVARSDSQITNSYPGQPISAETGLVAWYQLDDALVATTADDSSSNGFDASLLAGTGGTAAKFVEVPVEAQIGGADVLVKLDAYDVDTAQTGLTWYITEAPAHGTLYQNILGSLGSQISAPPSTALLTYALSGGKVFYTPPASGAFTTDSFKFQISDGSQLSAEITVNIVFGDGVAVMNFVGGSSSTSMGKGKAQLSSVSSGAAGVQTSRFSLSSSGATSSGVLFPLSAVITAPVEGGVGLTGESLNVTVQTAGVTSPMTRVDILANGVWIGQAVPTGDGVYELAIDGLAAGDYELTAVVSDAASSGGVSAPVNVSVYDLKPGQ
ncbi:MAG TPA: LamG-like jellyroll fold domain-containing protein [Verrucomicrobiae bacterium]